MVCQNQKLDKDRSLEQTPNGKYGIVVDGANLPRGTREDVRGFSLCPSYSTMDLKRIEHLAKKNADRENRYSASLQYNNKNFLARNSIKPQLARISSLHSVIDEDLKFTFME